MLGQRTVLARVPTYGLSYIFPFYQWANLENAPTIQESRGVPRGDAQDARASPLPPPRAYPPPGHVHPPPPQPERLGMSKDEAVCNKKKMQVCLPKHNYCIFYPRFLRI
jgi:hypothetical protein